MTIPDSFKGKTSINQKPSAALKKLHIAYEKKVSSAPNFASFTPYDLEVYIENLLQNDSNFLNIKRVAGSKEHGADITCIRILDNALIVIQVKHYWKSTLSIEAIKQILWAKQSYSAQIGIIATTSSKIPQDVYTEARKLNIPILALSDLLIWSEGKSPSVLFFKI